jgi:hypothetical protein
MCYDWFIGHVQSLAMSPEDCCEDQGNYNVAHELWLFIPRGKILLNPPHGITEEQRLAVQELIYMVEEIPEEARRWTVIAQESVENMRHKAWRNARIQANIVLRELAPIAISREKFYS